MSDKPPCELAAPGIRKASDLRELARLKEKYEEHPKETPMNLIDIITDAIACDDTTDPEGNGLEIIAIYENSSTDTQAIINAIMVNLCGWNMETLINRTRETETLGDA